MSKYISAFFVAVMLSLLTGLLANYGYYIFFEKSYIYMVEYSIKNNHLHPVYFYTLRGRDGCRYLKQMEPKEMPIKMSKCEITALDRVDFPIKRVKIK